MKRAEGEEPIKCITCSTWVGEWYFCVCVWVFVYGVVWRGGRLSSDFGGSLSLSVGVFEDRCSLENDPKKDGFAERTDLMREKNNDQSGLRCLSFDGRMSQGEKRLRAQMTRNKIVLS